MDPLLILILAVVAGIVVWIASGLYLRYQSGPSAKEMVERAIRRQREASAKREESKLEPESLAVVRVTDAEIICEHPDGRSDRVRRDELVKVEIVTTDEGPFAPDLFWALHHAGGVCAIPQSARGGEELLEHLQSLSGFDHGTFIEAMGSTDRARFLCWERKLEGP
ncbi:MAG TPA: hypothetical protein VK116_00750 [Planctomycetota bacterium]|nr:hypothetical protein [Planctomycetota bacterium]